MTSGAHRPPRPLNHILVSIQFGNGGNLENFDVGQYLIDVGHFDVEAVSRALQYGTPFLTSNNTPCSLSHL